MSNAHSVTWNGKHNHRKTNGTLEIDGPFRDRTVNINSKHGLFGRRRKGSVTTSSQLTPAGQDLKNSAQQVQQGRQGIKHALGEGLKFS
ncbi:hypothetical protein FJU08_15285 [Martelella alba]|uniref:Uncharacterized protein n=1 Tax=Martelella alba TaxID=2590451 RepID=A0A506U7Y0_9HYPH|nr:hypothetical protein [Martelella alba]TPW29211.1 hypothetical protein FJU08_15285 [Martelella alba]